MSTKKQKDISYIDKLELLSSAVNINQELGYPKFSNDGQYLQIYSLDEMRNMIGRPTDDSQNLFTVRMLLLLESRPIFNATSYHKAIKDILGHYFRDAEGKNQFKPIFLINDILRYWRTLCLNYELIRNDPNLPWRKKNINLKFSRMLTVFATILPLIAKPVSMEKDVIELTTLTPLERLAKGLDHLQDDKLEDEFIKLLSLYEEFLGIKEKSDSKNYPDNIKSTEINQMAENFSSFLHTCLTHKKIDIEYRKCLIL